MIPRGTLDIGYRDLAAGFGYCLVPDNSVKAQAAAEAAWSAANDSLACLSVRSGFDLLLQELALPIGSEVLVSAVTIPDMITILVHHGLVPIPLDIDLQTLAVDAEQAAQLIGPATKMLLVAHLFGSRMQLDPVIAVAQRHGLVIVEDCAQAYDGSAFRGHPASDVSLFSFGTIKMHTALGGALLCVRNRSLLARLRLRQAAYPRQRRLAFGQRVARCIALKTLSLPWLFTLFVWMCRIRAIDHDQFISQATRGFAGPDLFARLRHQPAVPLLRLLARRLDRTDQQRIARRAAGIRSIAAKLPCDYRLGTATHHHTHWVLPIQTGDPKRLIHTLRSHGFDGTSKASSLFVVPAPANRPELAAGRAQHLLAHLVYLPVSPALRKRHALRLGQIIAAFEQAGDTVRATTQAARQTL